MCKALENSNIGNRASTVCVRLGNRVPAVCGGPWKMVRFGSRWTSVCVMGAGTRRSGRKWRGAVTRTPRHRHRQGTGIDMA